MTLETPSSAGSTALSRIVFLDFDGVMHPRGCTIDRYFCHLPLLEDWLRGRPSIGVVISSSWREVHPLDETRSFFSADLQARILSVTPVLGADRCAQWEGQSPPPERETEVLGWMRGSGRSWQWAALDDQPELYRADCPWLVLCDGLVGLTEAELELVDGLLG
jgi:hypothetical protein